jgi:hypothetical protein
MIIGEIVAVMAYHGDAVMGLKGYSAIVRIFMPKGG